MKSWKLIIFLIIMAFVVFFAGFNISNVSSISFGFFELREVPIFLSLFIAFLLGAFIMLPFTFFRGRKGAKKKQVKSSKSKNKESIEATDSESVILEDQDVSPGSKPQSKKKGNEEV